MYLVGVVVTWVSNSKNKDFLYEHEASIIHKIAGGHKFAPGKYDEKTLVDNYFIFSSGDKDGSEQEEEL